MRKDLTEIVLVVDRSGSMNAIRGDAEGGVNHLIEEQKKLDGDAVLTLVQFDSEYEFVHVRKDINKVGKYELVPRNMTALLDAVGRTINTVGEKLSKLPEEERPGLVLFAIVTDGKENDSKEFTREQVKSMIDHQKNEYNWQFTFLAQGDENFVEARELGIDADGASFSGQNVRQAYEATSGKFGRMRNAAVKGQKVDNSYTKEELRSMK